jgi:hypothetical protein
VFTTLVEYIFDGFPMRLKITIDSDITAANNFHVQPPGADYSNKVRKAFQNVHRLEGRAPITEVFRLAVAKRSAFF